MEQTVWPELVAVVPAACSEAACLLAEPFSAGGLMVEDYSDLESGVEEVARIDLIDEDLQQKDRSRVRIHLYFSAEEERRQAKSALTELFEHDGIDVTFDEDEARQEDWAETWKQYYHPMEIGDRLLLCPSWELKEPENGRVRMILDPGMAFGTGSHETTRLCLELLQKCDLKNEPILDVGCGSGILAICGLLLGAEKAVGCDIDELAVKTARENADRNGVGSRASFVQGSLTDGITGTYQVICANIVADVIKMLLPDVRRFLKPGGVLICSGILDVRYEEVKAAAEQAGLKLDDVRRDGCWVAFSASFPD